jgi:hypothetical protein
VVKHEESDGCDGVESDLEPENVPLKKERGRQSRFSARGEETRGWLTHPEGLFRIIAPELRPPTTPASPPAAKLSPDRAKNSGESATVDGSRYTADSPDDRGLHFIGTTSAGIAPMTEEVESMAPMSTPPPMSMDMEVALAEMIAPTRAMTAGTPARYLRSRRSERRPW